VDLEKIKQLGLPFWLAGGYGTAEKLRSALAAGATGVQVGTAFAFCMESGLRDDYKQALLNKSISGEAEVFTDAMASPTGYPFKAAQLEGTLSEREVYLARPRICDLGYLREPYRSAEGTIEYRCAGEPVSVYLASEGQEEKTVGRKCLCNALLANIGHAQVRGGKYTESGLVTSGDDLSEVQSFLPLNRAGYTAADVIAKLLES
ncbi:MAG: nitronate monooxygenase, partial [Candidatus Acidiferrum sp.]